jgi:hypothetical protein
MHRSGLVVPPVAPRRRFAAALALGIGAVQLAAWTAFAAGGAPARVTCEILENGKPASGVVRLLQGEAEIASGACGKPVEAPAGSYMAVLALDGALDGPEQRKPLTLAAGQSLKVNADFPTGLLEVRIRSAGRDAAGMAIIRKDGKQIGTLGSGVSAHLSTGSYEVIGRYRAQERRFDGVHIEADKRTTLEASFE